MSRYPMRKLGEVLRPVERPVEVAPDQTYPVVGVYSFGKGLFSKPAISGSSTSYRTLNQLRRGDFLVARLNAWEGAVAVVGAEFDGACVSSEFPTFEIRDRAIDEGYLSALCMWPAFWKQFSDGTQGSMVRRKRIGADKALQITIPLPDSTEQRRIAGWLAGVRSRHVTATIRAGALPRIQSSLPALIDSLSSRRRTRLRRLGDLLSPINDLVRPGDDPAPADSFVGLQHVESHTGRRIGAVPAGGAQGRKFRFQPGDITYGYLRPYLNKVWLADRWGLCSVDQYVLRPTRPELAKWISYQLRSRAILSHAIDLTHSLQLPRLRSGLLLDLQVPVPDDAEVEALVRELDAMNTRVLSLQSLHRRRSVLLAALQPSILTEAFAGNL